MMLYSTTRQALNHTDPVKEQKWNVLYIYLHDMVDSRELIATH